MAIVLAESDVKELLPMQALIQSMERAVEEFSARRVQQPVRTVLPVGDQKAFFGVMPAFVPSLPALGAKLVTLFPANTERGLPTHLATIALFDPDTGALVAMLDGRYITEARTAAVSAVSVKHLARQDAQVLAIIGTGVQARSHLEAISCISTLRDVRIWSRSAEHRDVFAREMKHCAHAPIVAAATAQEAVAGADIIVLVTSSREPVIQSEWITRGAHICAVGACRPDQREMDPAVVARARLYVDSLEGALAEAGDIVLAIREGLFDASHILGELGDVVGGRQPGRLNENDVTIFKSLGMAVEDVAAAHLAVERARARGMGRNVEL